MRQPAVPFRNTVEAAAAVAAAEEIAAGSEADGRAHAPAGTPLATVPRGGSRPPLCECLSTHARARGKVWHTACYFPHIMG